MCNEKMQVQMCKQKIQVQIYVLKCSSVFESVKIEVYANK